MAMTVLFYSHTSRAASAIEKKQADDPPAWSCFCRDFGMKGAFETDRGAVKKAGRLSGLPDVLPLIVYLHF